MNWKSFLFTVLAVIVASIVVHFATREMDRRGITGGAKPAPAPAPPVSNEEGVEVDPISGAKTR